MPKVLVERAERMSVGGVVVRGWKAGELPALARRLSMCWMLWWVRSAVARAVQTSGGEVTSRVVRIRLLVGEVGLRAERMGLGLRVVAMTVVLGLLRRCWVIARPRPGGLLGGGGDSSHGMGLEVPLLAPVMSQMMFVGGASFETDEGFVVMVSECDRISSGEIVRSPGCVMKMKKS